MGLKDEIPIFAHPALKGEKAKISLYTFKNICKYFEVFYVSS